jgi:hypothetical protein
MPNNKCFQLADTQLTAGDGIQDRNANLQTTLGDIPMTPRRLCLPLSLLFLVGFLIPISTASAATPPPIIDSWYVSANWYATYNTGGGHSVWYNFGYNSKTDGFVYLDFAQPCWVPNSGWGLNSWQFGCQDYQTIEAELTSIRNGYDANSAHHSGTDRILEIGINHSTDHPTWNYDNAGTGIAQIIDQVGNGNWIQLNGAVDFEPQWPGTPSHCMNYVDGWNSQEYGGQNRILYNFGWLDENTNQWNSLTHTPSYPYGWTPDELNKLSWKGQLEDNFLQEYASGWTTQLEHLDLYSYYNTSAGAWLVPAVLGGGNEGYLDDNTAWQDTLSALRGDSHTTQTYISYLSDAQAL